MSLLGYLLVLSAALSCTAVPAPDGSCPMPERLDDAELQGDWDAESYPPKTDATYQCRPGFSRHGSIKRTCREGKWVITGNGICKKKPCGHPGDIPFGSFHLTKEESFIFGAVVEYVCEEGYRMVSKERTRQCTANGWSNYKPHCEVRNCPPVEAAGNVNVLTTSYDEEYSVGQVVRFECKDPSLKLNGASEIFCTSEGEWNVEPPSCIAISCKAPEVDNGRVNNQRKFVYGNNEIIQITCNEGFFTIKNGESTCTKDDWIPKPTCNEIVCSSYHPVEKGRLISTQTVYRYGDEIDVECDRGYMLQTEPNKRRKCTSNGWSPSIRCVSKKCDRPDIQNGHAEQYYYFPLDTGRRIYYECEDNFVTPSRKYWEYIYCTEAGWDPEPRCLRKCTPSEESLENARLINRQSVYLEGEKVAFQCSGNYKTAEGKTNGEITCLPNGKFTRASCSLKCQAPQLQNGKLTPFKREFEIGEYLQYECNKGYMTRRRKLIDRTRCVDGRWSETPSCIDITCRHQNTDYKDGDLVKYTCPRGKRPTTDIGQCYYYGLGPPLDCQDIDCTIPDTSGLVLSPHYPSYKINRKVSFSCREGFGRFGSLESSCTENGWNPPLPKCQEIVCRIAEQANLIRNPYKVAYKENDKVSLSCEKGFVKKGSDIQTTSICSKNGWNPPLPTCEGADVPTDNPNDKAEPTKAVITEMSPDDNEKQEPTKAVITETSPDDNEKQGKEKCPLAYSPNNAEIIDPKEEYYSNDNVTMKCSRGYKMYGSPTVRCIEGKWEQPPECIRLVPCKAPSTIKNGNLLESSKREIYVTDDIVQYSCKSGFHISLSDEMTCLNGRWSTPPKCTEDSCDGAPEVTDASIQERKKTFNHGERAKYLCNSGFRFSGEDSANCIEGKWFNIPTCVATSCDSLPTVPNSIMKEKPKDSYVSGEKVTYSCKHGYSLEKSGEALCENTLWLDVPVCRKIGEQCGPPPTVQFGDTVQIRKVSYKSGESVDYRCPNYHKLKGNKLVRCFNGVWDEAPVCLEPCTAKQKDMEENNIQLRWTGEKKLYSEHGDWITFSCRYGYEAPPNTQMRVACEHGKLPYPKCFKMGFCVLQQAIMIVNSINYNKGNVVDPEQTITFQCNEGMMAESKLEAKCERGNINYPRCTSAKSCKTPEIINGLLKTEQQDSYDSGSSVTFECKENYVLNGPINAKCENGQWIDLPVCHRPCKISSEGLTKSNIQLLSSDDQKNILETNYKHGTELTVNCKSGFKRPNQARLLIECYDGKFRYPRCFSGQTCRLDQEGLDQNNLELDEVHDNEVFYTEGEIIQFKCKNGFHHRGQPTGTCSDQKPIYPTCAASSSV